MSKIDYKALGREAAEQGEDHTKVKESQGIPLPPEGDTVMRLVDYIELGEHVKMHDGKPKDAAPQVMITFELLSPKHIREIEVDGKKVKVANRITLPDLPLFLSEKANFRKLFDRMADKDESIKNMIMLLGEPFLGTVVHNKVGDKTYANLRGKDGYTIRPPYIEVRDADGLATGERKKLAVPPALSSLRGFLWNNPSREQWDTLFIDGEFKSKDEKGNEVVKSKNYIQNKIKSAANFADSKIMEILGGIDSVETHLEDTEVPFDVEDTVELEDTVVAEKKPAKKSTKKATTIAPDEDELAAMGLTE